MNVWNNAVITDQGIALLTKLIAGNTLDITRVIAGTGYVTPGLLQSQTEVIDPWMELDIQPVYYPEFGKCKLTTTITNDDVETGKLEATLTYAGEPIATVPLVAAESVAKSEALQVWEQGQAVLTAPWFLVIMAAIAALIIVYIILILLYRRKQRQLRRVKRFREM